MSRAADNQRRYRQRRREGLTVVRVPVTPEVIEALIVAGRLDEQAALDDDRLGDGMAGVLRQWAKWWLQKNRYR